MISEDTHSSEQWVLTHLGAPAAWGCIPSNAPDDIIVAVVDSGVADNHEDLAPMPLRTVIPGQTRDDEDHGTMVAGTIGAIRDNERGIAGVAKVRILSIKFCSAQVLPSAKRGAEAINKLLDPPVNRPRVIVLPWDVGYTTDALHDAIERAGSEGAVVVVAAGNHSLDNDKYPNWPANYGDMDHVITVMATDENYERASFSNFGKKTVHLAAPETVRAAAAGVAGIKPKVNILSTVPYYGPRNPGTSFWAGYRFFRGTSAAAAQVAGLVALIRAKNPNWTAAQVKSHVLAKARPVPALERFCATGGIADYQRALCS